MQLKCTPPDCLSPSSVQASFGFNFGALGARTTKQPSLPPQPSSRRTPVQRTPRGTNGSVQRHRSASIQHSGSSRRQKTPKDHTVTPQLGKRKRGSPHAQLAADDVDADELSPDRDDAVRSIEKSRRIVGTVSPIHEEFDEAPDELSILDNGNTITPKVLLGTSAISNGTPVSGMAKKRASMNRMPQKTPNTSKSGSMAISSRKSIPQRSKSTDLTPFTPGLFPDSRSRPSASHFDPKLDTPSAVLAAEESEDELSPSQLNGTVLDVVTTELSSQPAAQDDVDDGDDMDELSSPMQITSTPKTLTTRNTADDGSSHPAKRAVTLMVAEEEEHEPVVKAPSDTIRRRRLPKSTKANEVKARATPIASRPNKDLPKDEQGREIDELSPESERMAYRHKNRQKQRNKQNLDKSDAEIPEVTENRELEEQPEPTPLPTVERQSPKQTSRPKTSTEKQPNKRQKFSGPKHAISVMRIKGSTVRGITVADTTRTILEETINYRLNRMAEKMQTSSDAFRRKDLRSEINLSLSFKESLDEKLLDLQDANDVLSINLQKMKLFKRDNGELRREILTFQNNRQEIALEHDDIQATFETEKGRVDARNKLNMNLFDIEAAIQDGRKRARREGRDDEGPEIPLSMLLETVGKDVGSHGGGLLANITAFNGVLERAAGWLEGRA